jgi:hypothetical protein
MTTYVADLGRGYRPIIFELTDTTIGNGRQGKVYPMPKAPEYCVKIYSDPSKIENLEARLLSLTQFGGLEWHVGSVSRSN